MELVLAWEFKFPSRYSPSTEFRRGVANAAAFLSEIQNYRQKVNFRVLSDGFGETCNPTVRCESFQFLHRTLKFTIANPYVKWFWRGISVLAWKSGLGVEFKFPPLVQGRKMFWVHPPSVRPPVRPPSGTVRPSVRPPGLGPAEPIYTNINSRSTAMGGCYSY